MSKSAASIFFMTLALLLAACGDRDVDNPNDTCHYNGVAYKTGNVFKATDGCNTCVCNPEGTQSVGCSAKKCDGTTKKDTCFYNGKTYKAGDVFKAADGCNSCQCNPSGTYGVGCTKKGCVDLGTDDAGAPGYDYAFGGDKCGFEGTVCGSLCINISSDPQHCGECFNACGGKEQCQGGKCYPY